MAYRLDRRVAVLSFEGGQLEGSEIRCRLDVPLKTLFGIQSAAESGDVIGAMSMFAEQVLESWNIEDENGAIVPATAEGLQMLPLSVCSLVLTSWVKAVSSTPLG